MSTPPKKIWKPQILDMESVKAAAEATLRAGGFEGRLKKDREEALRRLEPGEAFENEGVFVGIWQPKDRDGVSLGKVFNVFAAPQDLPETMKYVDAVKYIAGLKDWNGFDGTNYATDKEIYTALKDGSYNGGWIIPPRDILSGNDLDEKKITPDNLFDYQDRGALKGTFKTAASSGSDCPDWYWSSTESRDYSFYVRGVRFSDGGEFWHRKNDYRLSCRPVRLVEASAPAPAPG